MEDDELTQDILDQFDSICTQHQRGLANQKTNQPNGVSAYLEDSNYGDQAKKTNSLNRTTSLTLNLNTVANDHYNEVTKFFDVAAFFGEDEAVRLKKEVADLREQLYMKLGELSTLKESANRLNAAKSDAISRLETNLNMEREEFQRKLNELTTQLAFREADYRLVSTELLQVKEQLAQAKSMTLPDKLADFSPASQLIAAVAASPHNAEKDLSKHAPTGQLPTAVTPIPIKRPPGIYEGTWKIALRSKPELLASPSQTHPKGAKVVQPTTIFNTDLTNGDLDSVETPRKRARHDFHPDVYLQKTPECTNITVTDAAVETEPPALTSRCLDFRISCVRQNSIPETCIELPSYPSHPSILASALAKLDFTDNGVQEKKQYSRTLSTSWPSMGVSLDPVAYMRSLDGYLKGLDILKTVMPPDLLGLNHGSSLYLKRLRLALPFLLARIEEVLKIVPKFFESEMDKSSYGHIQSDQSIKNIADVPSNENADCWGVEDEIGYLGEDPFAGAPASQVVAPLRIGNTHKRFPTLSRIFSSTAPAQFASTSLRNPTDATTTLQEPLSTTHGPWSTLFLQCMEQLQLIVCFLQHYQLSMKFQSKHDIGAHNNNIVDLTFCLQAVARPVSKLISDLVDVVLSRWKKHGEFDSLPTVYPIASLTSSVLTNFPSQVNRRCRDEVSIDSTNHMTSHLLPLLTVKALNLVTSMAFLISPDQLHFSRDSVDVSSLSFPTLVECIILAHGTTQLSVTPSLELSIIVAFLRVCKYTNWNLPHHRHPWLEEPVPQKMHTDAAADRCDYCRQCFVSHVKCTLSTLVTWVRTVADKLLTSTTKDKESSTGLSTVGTGVEAEHRLVVLLDEFSGFIASLANRGEAFSWPENCPCKAEVYSTLVNLALKPVQYLLTTPTSCWSDSNTADTKNPRLVFHSRCISALGQLTRALVGLRWRHGDSTFQAQTDCLPAYFFLISSLSSWVQQVKISSGNATALSDLLFNLEAVLRPELIEELHDFESGTEKTTS